MKLSTLLVDLTALHAQHGDMDVFIDKSHPAWGEVGAALKINELRPGNIEHPEPFLLLRETTREEMQEIFNHAKQFHAKMNEKAALVAEKLSQNHDPNIIGFPQPNLPVPPESN